jgi:erythromycin esterase
MATNLELLVDNLYAGKKVMVWAHNSHIAHDASAVSEWDWNNMGKWIFGHYGSQVYTIGLYMYQGSAAWNGGTVYTIPPAPDDSVEGLLHAAGDPYVFLDISNVTNSTSGAAWMSQDFPIRDWGVYNMDLTLKNEYDGLLQIDTVQPPTYVPFPQSAQARGLSTAADRLMFRP